MRLLNLDLKKAILKIVLTFILIKDIFDILNSVVFDNLLLEYVLIFELKRYLISNIDLKSCFIS